MKILWDKIFERFTKEYLLLVVNVDNNHYSRIIKSSGKIEKRHNS